MNNNNFDIEERQDKVSMLTQEINAIINGERDLTNYKPPEELEDLLGKEKDSEKAAVGSANPTSDTKQPVPEEDLEPINQREGDGIKKDTYEMYCVSCRLEQTEVVETCRRCKRSVITSEQRQNVLMQKVDQQKDEKKQRKIKKSNWDNWKKTQEIIQDKYSINNSKWDYFIDEESEEEFEKKEKEHVVPPKDDPNFKAMEADLDQRASRIARKRDAAEKFKKQGNEFLKQQRFQDAEEQYTQAIDLIKDSKVQYTNRALAYIKLSKYKEAIKDCSECLEIAEYLNNGIQENQEICFKAQSRRALAYKSLNQLDEALKDIEEAIKLVEDSSAVKLKEQILDQMKSASMLVGVKQIEQQFEQLREGQGMDPELLDNFEIDKFQDTICKNPPSDSNSKDTDQLRINGPMIIFKVMVERFTRNKDWRTPDEKELNVLWKIYHKYQENSEHCEKFLRYLLSIGFQDWLLNCVEYNTRVDTGHQVSPLIKIMDEFITQDFILDYYCKTNILLVCVKTIDNKKVDKNFRTNVISIIQKFAENKQVRGVSFDTTEKVNACLRICCHVLSLNEPSLTCSQALSTITNLCVLYKEKSFRYLTSTKESVFEHVKNKIKTSGPSFEEGQLELNEKVFHTLSSLALNEEFRELIKSDLIVLKKMINELQIENLLKVEGYSDRMNNILICLNNLLQGDENGNLSKALMQSDKSNKSKHLNLLGTCESIIINRDLMPDTLMRTFAVLSALVKNSPDLFIEKLFVRYSLPNTILNQVLESDDWNVLDSISRILCRAARAPSFQAFVRHDVAQDLKKDNEAINNLLKSFKAEEQEEMARQRDSDLVNPLQKLQAQVRKVVKQDPITSETSPQFSCVYNSATLLNILAEQEPTLLDNFEWVVAQVITIVKESTGKMRKNQAVCLSKLTTNAKCKEQQKINKGFEVLQSVHNPVKQVSKEKQNGDQLRQGVGSMQGWRQSMEDAHVADLQCGRGALFAVFDGHGSDLVSRYCAIFTSRELQNNPHFINGDQYSAMKDVFIKLEENLLSQEGREIMNKLIQSKKNIRSYSEDSNALLSYTFSNNQNKTGFKGKLNWTGGSTINSALVIDNRIFVSNSGDSRCIIVEKVSNRVQIAFASKDHKPDLKEEKKRIEAGGGFVSQGRVNGQLALSRSMGDFDQKTNRNVGREAQLVIVDPEVKEQVINPKTYFMVCACDGIWDVWSNLKVAEFVHEKIVSGMELPEIIERMFHQMCPSRINQMSVGTDNMTCIIVHFNKNN